MSEWNIIDNFLASQRAAQILRFIPVDVSVCDIGCGHEGTLLLSVKNKIKEGIGIDRKVSDFKDEKIMLINADIDGKTLPLPDEATDCVLFLAVLEHLNNPERTLAEIFRILKKGGTLIMTTPSPSSKPLLEFLASLNIVNKKEVEDHKRYWKKDEMTSLLEGTGFTKVDFSYFQFWLNQRAIAKK